MECDSETAKEIKKEGNHSKYLRKQEIESGYTTFSIDEERRYDGRSEEEISLEDESVDVEMEAVNAVLLEKLQDALSTLDAETYKLLESLYLLDECSSEEDYAHLIGVSSRTIRRRKEEVFGKILQYLQN